MFIVYRKQEDLLKPVSDRRWHILPDHRQGKNFTREASENLVSKDVMARLLICITPSVFYCLSLCFEALEWTGRLAVA